MTDESNEQTALERIATLETRVKLLELTLARAFGDKWLKQLNEQVKAQGDAK